MKSVDAFGTLAGKLGYADSKLFHRILSKLMVPEEAELVALLPATLDGLAIRLNKEEAAINRQLQQLASKGVVIATRKGYFFARDVMQVHDWTMSNPKMASNEYWDLWQEFSEEEWFRDVADEYIEGRPLRPVELIPMWRAIHTASEILPQYDLRWIMKEAKLIAIAPCPCRVRARQCDKPTEACIQTDRSADVVISKGMGRSISSEEAIQILGSFEELGLIHTSERSSGYCSCCACCCFFVRCFTKYGILNQAFPKSPYVSTVDRDICEGCQNCMDRCFFGAIDMKREEGQKKYKAVIDTEKCVGCGSCTVTCPSQAMSLKLVRPVVASQNQP